MCSANEYTSLDSGNLPYTAFENSTYTQLFQKLPTS